MQDELMSMEQKFSFLQSDKQHCEADFGKRLETNIKLIASLKTDIENEVNLFEERRNQNCDLSV